MSYNINLQTIADELDFDLEDVEMLIEVFLESTVLGMERLKKAIDDNNFENIYQASHGIKGSSANLTLMEISNIAQDMEHNSKEQNSINYLEKFNELEKLINNISA